MVSEEKKLLKFAIILGIPLTLGLIFIPLITGKTLKQYQLERPKVRRYFPISDDFQSEYSVERADTSWHIVPPFEFVDQTNQPFTEKDMTGKIVVANFIFTTCPGICPVMTGQLARVQEEFRGDRDVLFVSHTVDPTRDTPEVLEQFSRKFKAEEEQWKFVTGDPDELFDISKKGYFMYASPNDDPDAEEEFDHSGKLVLLDKDRVIRGFYYGLDSAKVDRLMLDINLLRLEYPRERTAVSYKVREEEEK